MLLTTLSLLGALAVPGDLHRYEGLALNADGSRIATVDSIRAERAMSDAHGVVVVRDPEGTIVATFDPCADCRYGGPAWSPDGRRLAFVASRAGRASLMIVDDDQAVARADIDGDAGMARWSPDGRSIALLVTPDAKKTAGATQPGARRVGEIGRADDSRRIALIDVADGAIRFVSPVGTFVYEYDWRPDGRGFVATAAEGDGDAHWWVASLRAFGLDGAARVIATPVDQIDLPRVSPDGRRVAFIGGRMSDFGSVGGDVFVVPFDGGRPVDVTPGFRGSFTAIRWEGASLRATVLVGGSIGTTLIDPATRRVGPVVTLPGSVASADAATQPERSGTGIASDATHTNVAYVVESFETAPAIAYGPLGRTRTITHDNDGRPPHVVARSVTWKNEGLDVQGWLLLPFGSTDASPRPLVVVVHGGPSAAHVPRYGADGTQRTLLARGYAIFLPNPRGSFGQGVAFANANYRAFGKADFRDILAGIDAVKKLASIDEARLGIMGHSYGGFMTMWAVTHTTRFRAAVAGAGVANWVSYYGQNGIDQWMKPFMGATLYDDPAIYDALSPIRTIRSARTPTLIYVGERDVEVPAAQSEEFWHGLKAMNVPTTLVIYEGEGHRIRKPDHEADLARRIVDWFDRYLVRP